MVVKGNKARTRSWGQVNSLVYQSKSDQTLVELWSEKDLCVGCSVFIEYA